MQTTLCPPPEQLKDYLSGKLDADSSENLARHLQDCVTCERTATELELEPDTLIELLQSDLPIAAGTENDGSSAEPRSDTGRSQSDNRVLEMPSEVGQYELLSRLGTGGMGAVYLARHKSLDKQVALKLLPALPAQNAEFVARFQREMRAAGKLDHPAIVRTTDAGEQQGIHFLVMDAIDGMDLSRIMRGEEKLAISDACEVIRQAAMGLAHAHEKGIVHRDVKPSNLMLDTGGQVRILDFGLAQIGFWDAGSAEITTVGQLMGTLDYMAPEQAERGGAVDYRADLYSMGSTLFRLLTGRAPLAAAPNLTPLEKLRLLATHKPPKLRSLRSDVPESLGQIVDAMLSSDPAGRPASATHAAELLEPFASGSDLVGLLNRARSKPDVNDESFVASPWLPRNLANDIAPAPIPTPLSDATSGGKNQSPNRVVVGLMLAGCLALLCAGIVFVLELGKGQLVIDSQADVHVKIVSVDDQGQRAEVDDLQIEPGTKTTRLKSGKYQITIDAASDSFAVTNQTFSIRNGQTVVATITSKPNAADAKFRAIDAAIDGNVSQAEDPRLNEVVYDGETLDTWLRRLKFERNPEEVTRALTAIFALADKDLRDVIQQPLVDFILSVDARGHGWFGVAVPALEKCCGDDFPVTVARVLNQLDEPEKLSVLRHSKEFLASGLSQSVGNETQFLDATATMLASESPKTALETAIALREIANNASGEAAPSLQQKIVRLLVDTGSLENESFWLAYPPSTFNFRNDGSRWSTHCVAFQQEVARRASAVAADKQTNDLLFTQAAVVLRTLADSGFELTKSQKESVSERLSVVLKQMAEDPSKAYVEVDLPDDLNRYVAPVTPLGVSTDPTHDSASKAIVIMNLISTAGLHDALSIELQSLFDAFRQLPLYGISNSIVELRNLGSQNWPQTVRHFKPNGQMNSLIRRVVYLQAGFLIGKNETELFARFETKLTADIAVEVDRALEALEFGNDQTKLIAFQTLFGMMPANYSERAIRVIEAYFATDSWWRSLEITHSAGLWVRAAGDDFAASFTRALEKCDASNRRRLLQIDLPRVQGFRCSDPNKITPLLTWCDKVLSNKDAADVSDDAETFAIVRLLTGLLRVTESVGSECQQRVIEHLKSYSAVDNQNFWLLQRIDETDDSRYSRTMRLAVLEKAIAQLSERAATNDVLDCQALAIIASGIDLFDALTESQRTSLITQLQSRIAAAAKDPAAHAEFHSLSSRFNPLGPNFGGTQFFISYFDNQPGRSEKPANITTLALNLLFDLAAGSDAKWLAATKPEIEALHIAAEGMHVMGRNVLGSPQSASSRRELVYHIWYLQTGSLLGKNLQELNERPAKLYVEEQERKRRFVQPGDTLAVYIPHVLPLNGEPPVIQAGKSTPVTGFPVPVSSEGTIQLPMIAPLTVKGLELTQVHALIEKAYQVDQNILRDDVPTGITVQFLLRDGQQVELRNIAGSSVVAQPSKK
ncbi:MAG: protein kinase [Planctomycetales bacterium]|nr:protein kinase [Planctomycetales bacterium]